MRPRSWNRVSLRFLLLSTALLAAYVGSFASYANNPQIFGPRTAQAGLPEIVFFSNELDHHLLLRKLYYPLISVWPRDTMFPNSTEFIVLMLCQQNDLMHLDIHLNWERLDQAESHQAE